MKRFITTLIAAAILTMGLAACANPSGGNSSSSLPQSSEADVSSGSSQQPQEDGKSDSSDLTYSSDDLGIAFSLPEILRGHSKLLTSQREAYGETVDVVSLYYMEGPNLPESDVPILTIEIMSPQCWEKTKAEGGPLGTELTTSEDGRVAVMTTLQSNPFSESEEAYDLFNQLPKELAAVSESFRFLTR